MSSTLITYEGTGSQTDFDIPFDYLKKTFVTVSIDSRVLKGGDQSDSGAEYYFLDKTKIRLRTAPSAGQFITIRRYTSETERVVSFKDASVLKASNLETSQLQAFHISAEARDIINDALVQDKDDNWDAKNHRIINVADPVNDQDAVTYKTYKEDAKGAYQARLGAESAQAKAETAQKASETAQSKAETAQGKAETAQRASETAQGKAETAQSKAETAQGKAETALEATETARDTTLGYKQEAEASLQETNTARDEAVNAKSVAIEASTNAKASELLAKDWATKDGIVSDGLGSAYYYAKESKTTFDSITTKVQEVTDSAVNTVNSTRDSAVSTVNSTRDQAVSRVTEEGGTQVSLATAQANTAREEADRSHQEAERAKQYADQASQGQLQADWNETDDSLSTFIKNKPVLGALAYKNSISYSEVTDAPTNIAKTDTQQTFTQAQTFNENVIIKGKNAVRSINGTTADTEGNVTIQEGLNLRIW